MRTRTAAVLAAFLLPLAASCSTDPASDPKPADPAPSKVGTVTTAPTELAPAWKPKLEAASDGATAACQTPSSGDCARAVDDIMAVVADLEAAIDEAGRAGYPESLVQIAKMRDAEATYVDEGCEGDPAADDPNSLCHRVVGVTVGAFTLTMTLLTDDLS